MNIGTLSTPRNAAFPPHFHRPRGPSRTWAKKFLEETVSALDYCAGDGREDDTRGFAKALQAAAGRTLFVPDGTYLLRETQVIPTDTSVVMNHNAVLKATVAMQTILETHQDVIHSFGLVTGGFYDCNSLALGGLWLKNINDFTVENIEVMNHAGSNGGIRLGRAAGPSSFGAYLSDIRINRLDGAAPANSKAVEFEHCGDSHLSNVQAIGQEFGVYGSYNDSKLTRVHCWNFGPTHGPMTAGFFCTGVDAQHVQCQVDGPCSSTAYYIGAARGSLIACNTNNPPAVDGGTDLTASCVFVDTGADATIVGCAFKGAVDARWAGAYAGPGVIKAWGNREINCNGVIGDVYPSGVFAGLPTAPRAGARYFITDANTAVFNAIVAGGGANFVPVVYNGVNWVVG